MSEAADSSSAMQTGVDKGFLVSSAPHLNEGSSTKSIMFTVAAAMLPMLAASVAFYGVRAIILVVVTTFGCLVAEAVGNRMRGRDMASLGDGSAIVTGMILAFSLPPSLNPYMGFIGGAIAIALAKAVFGGLGNNLFNPAMVGRAFLMVCFPAAMVTWAPTSFLMVDKQAELAEAKQVAVSELTQEDIDGITMATPLYQAAKYAEFVSKAASEPEKAEVHRAAAEQIRSEMPTQWNLFMGNVGGCIGETSAIAALIGGLFLVIRRIADWRQPLGVFAGVLAVSLLVMLLAPDKFQNPLYYLNSGALMFGAFFIATDYVGAPLTPKGRIIFGVSVGVLVMVIRLFGAYPEGFMFAILIMNAMTPLIERWTVPTPFGGHVAD